MSKGDKYFNPFDQLFILTGLKGVKEKWKRPAHNKMFAQWWRDIKVLSIFILLRLPPWRGSGFDRPSLRKHKRWVQLFPDKDDY